MFCVGVSSSTSSLLSFAFFLSIFYLFIRMAISHILPNIHKASYLGFFTKKDIFIIDTKLRPGIHEKIHIKIKLKYYSKNVLNTSLQICWNTLSKSFWATCSILIHERLQLSSKLFSLYLKWACRPQAFFRYKLMSNNWWEKGHNRFAEIWAGFGTI